MPEAPNIQQTDFTKESDADLLTLISWREEDDGGARGAWGELYVRYFDLLSRICMRYESQLGEHGVEDLVNDTLLRVFDAGADTFKPEETDPTKLRPLIAAWMSQIALNIFRMRLRSDNRLHTVQVGTFEFPVEEPTQLSDERAEQCELLGQVLADLKPRERDILLARFSNYHRSKGKQQFESHVLERLSEDWGITKDYVRQIFHRTMQKVNEQLSQSPAGGK